MLAWLKDTLCFFQFFFPQACSRFVVYLNVSSSLGSSHPGKERAETFPQCAGSCWPITTEWASWPIRDYREGALKGTGAKSVSDGGWQEELQRWQCTVIFWTWTWTSAYHVSFTYRALPKTSLDSCVSCKRMLLPKCISLHRPGRHKWAAPWGCLRAFMALVCFFPCGLCTSEFPASRTCTVIISH